MSRKVITKNKRARFNYEVSDTYEAGIELKGSEVKSLRAGQVDLKDSFAHIRDGEVWLVGCYIGPYGFARDGGHEPERSRRLLLHRREIDRIAGKTAQQGLTLVPLSLYFQNGKVKIELGLAKGRRKVDKRQLIKEREEKREMDRAKSYRPR